MPTKHHRPAPTVLMQFLQQQHSIMLMHASLSSNSACKDWNAPLLPWQEEALKRQSQQNASKLPLTQISQFFEQSMQGVKRYLASPYQRHTWPYSTIMSRGSMQLCPFSNDLTKPPVLTIPSLINRAHILDITPKMSVMRYLVAAGYAPYIVDWDDPVATEYGYDIEDYVTEHVVPAMRLVYQRHQKPLRLIGYCMGSILLLKALKSAAIAVESMILLSPPWDFSVPVFSHLKKWHMADMLSDEPVVPAALVQWMLYVTYPDQVAEKFQAFAKEPPSSDKAALFVAIEDWLQQGMAMTQPVMRTLLEEWVGQNSLMQEAITCDAPVLLVCPKRDHVVPEISSIALCKHLLNATLYRPEGGHISAVVGPQAMNQHWPHIVSWLETNKASKSAYAA